jgi:hypothetical protein
MVEVVHVSAAEGWITRDTVFPAAFADSSPDSYPLHTSPHHPMPSVRHSRQERCGELGNNARRQ